MFLSMHSSFKKKVFKSGYFKQSWWGKKCAWGGLNKPGHRAIWFYTIKNNKCRWIPFCLWLETDGLLLCGVKEMLWVGDAVCFSSMSFHLFIFSECSSAWIFCLATSGCKAHGISPSARSHNGREVEELHKLISWAGIPKQNCVFF